MPCLHRWKGLNRLPCMIHVGSVMLVMNTVPMMSIVPKRLGISHPPPYQTLAGVIGSIFILLSSYFVCLLFNTSPLLRTVRLLVLISLSMFKFLTVMCIPKYTSQRNNALQYTISVHLTHTRNPTSTTRYSSCSL